MGIPFSFLGSIGGNTIMSRTMDEVYNRFFKEKKINDFDGFHAAFIEFCIFINNIMPGKRFTAPASKDIEDFYYKKWKEQKSTESRKDLLMEFVTKNVKVSKPNDNWIIVSGMVLPAAAVILKNNAENIQPVKRFKLHLIPNIVFVPALTLLGLTGVRLVQFSQETKSN